MKRTRTTMILSALIVLGVVLTGGVAGARAGHFKVATATDLTTTTTTTTATTTATTLSALSTTTDLVASPTVFVTVKFLENGLGGAKSIDYQLIVDGLSADLVCVNNGSNQPNGVPLSFNSIEPVTSASQTVPVTVKGTVDATETGVSWNLVDVAAAAFNFSCPTGQTAAVTFLSVGGLTIVDTANNSSAFVTANYPLTFGTR